MRVFISWSGELSKKIAELLKRNIRIMLKDVDPFVSSQSIEKGANWERRLTDELSNCNHGIICLTKGNMNNPWINFEAGALARNPQAKLQIIMINVQYSDIQDPLRWYQTTKLEKADLRELLGSINVDLKNPLSTEDLDIIFERSWKDIEKEVKSILKDTPDSDNVITTSGRVNKTQAISEEILKITRQMSVSLEGIAEQLPKTYSAVNALISNATMKHPFGYELRTVDNVEEMVKAIAPYRIIQFGSEEICTSDIESYGPFVFTEDVFDGKQLVFSNLTNVLFMGNQSTITVKPRYAQAMKFNNCSSIVIDGLNLGHTPELGTCAGNVIQLIDCNNIVLSNLRLFGCGIYGIYLQNCRGVFVSNTEIYQCTYGALSYYNSECYMSNISIHDCNNAFSLINVQSSIVVLDNCSVYNNTDVGQLTSKHNSQIFYRQLKCDNNSFKGLDDYIEGVKLD